MRHVGKKDELRKKDVTKLADSLLQQGFSQAFQTFLAEQKLFMTEVELAKKPVILYFLKDNTPVLLVVGDTYIPTLQAYREFPDQPLPKIKVDAGAVQFMINGADVMRPGMVEWDPFEEGQYVLIVNPMGHALSIGRAIISSEEMGEKGRVTKTLHHLNDDVWNFGAS